MTINRIESAAQLKAAIIKHYGTERGGAAAGAFAAEIESLGGVVPHRGIVYQVSQGFGEGYALFYSLWFWAKDNARALRHIAHVRDGRDLSRLIERRYASSVELVRECESLGFALGTPSISMWRSGKKQMTSGWATGLSMMVELADEIKNATPALV